MEQRRRQRFSKRFTCEIEAGHNRASGLVRDLSEHGLFVQTHFSVPTDSLVHITLSSTDMDAQPTLRFEAGVARKRVIPRRLQTSVPAGLGLEIIPPSHAFRRLVEQLTPQDHAPERAQLASIQHDEAVIRAFRFRMIRADRKGAPRLLTIRCATEASARARAIARLGAGWKIADVQPL